MDKQELEDALESLEGGYEDLSYRYDNILKENKELKQSCSPPTLTEEDIERIVAKHHDCYEVEKELERLEKENKELTQKLKDIEDARAIKVEVPDSWEIKDD